MPTDLTQQEIERELKRLAPFFHKINLPFGLTTYQPTSSRRKIEYTRVENLIKHSFPKLVEVCGGTLEKQKILDVGCNCGGFVFEAAKLGANVLGIDIVERYIEQANFIKRALDLDTVKFDVMGIEQVTQENLGKFDITFCFGLVYHLENPIQDMKKLSSVTEKVMLVDTKLIKTPFRRDAFWRMSFPEISNEQSKDATTSLWRSGQQRAQFIPNERAVIELLKFLGFSKVEKIKPQQKNLEKRYYKGTRATFLAIR